MGLVTSRVERFRAAWRAHPCLVSAVQLVLVLAMFPAFYVQVSFHRAVTPESDARIPAEWEAGFMDHGRIVRWYSVARHPVLYFSSLTELVAAGTMVVCTVAVYGMGRAPQHAGRLQDSMPGE